MNRKTAKQEVKDREPSFLQEAKQRVGGHTTYICPVCGNGSGSSGDGIALDTHNKRGRYYKCFKCGLYGDVIELWKCHTGQTDDKEAFKNLYSYYGLNVENDRPTAKEDFKPEYQKQAKNEQYTHNNTHISTYTETTTQEINYSDYYIECNKRLVETDYLSKRGLSLEVLNKFKIGYDPNFKGIKGKIWKAIIIPTGKSSYVARNTEAVTEDRYKKTGTTRLFNLKAFKTDKPIFIVEGELDALSIIEAGAEAVALGSANNYKKLLDNVEKDKPKHTLIIALDNDETGEKDATELCKGLEELNIPFYKYNPYKDNKDANEALLSNKQDLQEELKKAESEALAVENEETEKRREEYLKTSTAYHLQEFVNGIADSVNTPYIPTGFTNLDKILDGGLYEGLYIIGAISSLGKTTLALQIADQIAEAGQDILIFSLEMARNELMSKSISRLTLLEVLQNKGNVRNAKTARGITTGSRYSAYSSTENQIIENAIKKYGEYAKNIYISEGIGDIGTEQIKETVKNHINITGRKPVVLIDYVQILAPADIRATDKQNTDKAVLELKRLSRDYKLPVIGISSFNRANYKEKVTMEAFKESGSLEYGSDVLIGLQLKGAGEKNFNANDEKRKNPRNVELVILKNRNGATGNTVNYEYYPLFNYFKEV